MDLRYALPFAIATAAILAACGQSSSGSLEGGEDDSNLDQGSAATPGGGSGGAAAGGGGAAPAPGDVGSGTATTLSTRGKQFFASDIFPFINAECATCHVAGREGNPSYVVKDDPAKTYELVYANGLATATSALATRGVHGTGNAAPALTDDQKAKFQQWIAMEAEDGGNKAQGFVLAKFGTCMDQTKFNAIGFQDLRTTRRTDQNNTNKLTPWNENANNCTGCDNAQCKVCHSADDATGFVMAMGNNLLPADWTFTQSQLATPSYIQKYIATGPDGKPIPSDGIKKKSDTTLLGLAYTHPMFTIPADMQARMLDFVNDAITKYNAGTCGQ